MSNLIEKLDKLEQTVKHMPGRHSQQRHAGERQSVGVFGDRPIAEPNDGFKNDYNRRAYKMRADSYMREKYGETYEVHTALDAKASAESFGSLIDLADARSGYGSYTRLAISEGSSGERRAYVEKPREG